MRQTPRHHMQPIQICTKCLLPDMSRIHAAGLMGCVLVARYANQQWRMVINKSAKMIMAGEAIAALSANACARGARLWRRADDCDGVRSCISTFPSLHRSLDGRRPADCFGTSAPMPRAISVAPATNLPAPPPLSLKSGLSMLRARRCQ